MTNRFCNQQSQFSAAKQSVGEPSRLKLIDVGSHESELLNIDGGATNWGPYPSLYFKWMFESATGRS